MYNSIYKMNKNGVKNRYYLLFFFSINYIFVVIEIKFKSP